MGSSSGRRRRITREGGVRRRERGEGQGRAGGTHGLWHQATPRSQLLLLEPNRRQPHTHLCGAGGAPAGWRPLKLTGSRASAPSHCSDAGAQQAKRVSGMQRMPVSERQPSTLAALPACLHVPAPACPQINPAWHLPGCPSQPATHQGSPSHTYTSFGACLSSPAPHLV